MMPTPEEHAAMPGRVAARREPIRVLIVDDSSLARRIIQSSLEPHPMIQVVGTAADPYIARDKILELNPDVITLDVEMPRMDGITFLKRLMRHRPMPVIIMSSVTTQGSEKAMEALQAGAVDVIEKPGGAFSAHTDGFMLAQKIVAAADARLSAPANTEVFQRPPVREPVGVPRAAAGRQVILLGASTGGTEALRVVLQDMRGDLPGICIAQHIPGYFSKAFAERLNRVCPMEVREARPGDLLHPGLALVAPGGWHMVLKWRVNRYEVELNQGPPVHYQRPSVDVLFDSAVKAGAGPHATAALLTGMGTDGAAGLLRLREAGAKTLAQDEQSCVVFGMPREAIRLGGARQVAPLSRIGKMLTDWSLQGSAVIA